MALGCGLAQSQTTGTSRNFSVTVVTQSPANPGTHPEILLFRVVRRPSKWELWRLTGQADQIVLAGPAMLPLAFALLRRRKVVITHHGYQSICPNGSLFHLPTQTSCPGHFRAGRYRECVACMRVEKTTVDSIRSVLVTFPRRWMCHWSTHNVSVSEHVSRRTDLKGRCVIRNGV